MSHGDRPPILHCARMRLRKAAPLLVTAILAFPVELNAQQGTGTETARRPLVIEDYYRLTSVGSARISPDGRHVLYTVSRRVEEDNGTVTQTWLVASDGRSEPRRVEHEGKDVSGAEWRSDGLLLYRVDDASWVIDPRSDGGPPVVAEPPERGAVASRDGAWYAVARDVPAPRAEPVYASDFERRHAERFRGIRFDWLNHKRDGRPDPVPDPRDPHANPASEIFVTPVGGGEARQLTRLGLQPSNLEWLPDGSGLVFAADEEYRDELKYGRADLWHASLDGTIRRLTDDGYVYSNPTFSPDGRQLAYTRSFGTDMVIRDALDHGGPRDLFVLGWPGGEPLNLTASWDLDAGSPMWSPDARWIYFTAGIGGETHLFRVSPRGSAVEQVTRGPRRLGGLSIDRAFRRMAYTVGVHDAPPEIHVADIDGSNERRLTDIHADFLAEAQPSPTERVRYTSYDGTPIEGWLTFPHGYQEDGGPYPLIVSNHGGPHSAIGYGFDFKDQLFAANGYFVLEVNFRGSTGYGDAFKWATWGAWGTRDGEDVMAGVDYVLSKYPIDPARVGTTGHSYGGFMTNWLITAYPDRFAAAVSGAGISNWISDYGMADIARTKETEFYGKPWEPRAREIMIRQSPLYYADRVRTPTLFVHGEVDYRVPYAEAEQFFFALRKNGVPAEVIRYDGQAHGIGGHWNNVHRMLNELRWWNTWLKPRPRT